MKTPIRLVPAFAALLLAIPACAQRHDSRTTSHSGTIIISTHEGRRTELRSTGEVELNEEGDWITGLSSDARLSVEESGSGPDRRVEFRPDGDGGVRVTYSVNGRERPLDAEGREWAQRVVRRAVRESGLGAEARVRRIRASRGVDGVLREIAELETDTGRRIYYLTLLESGAMSSAEFARVMDDAGERMGSDTETRIVLLQALERARDGARVAAVLRAADGIDSDTEMRIVLHQAVEGGRLDGGDAREAFFRALGRIDSDTETRIVLHTAAERRLHEGGSRDEYFRAVDGIGSDTERRIVLSTVLDARPEEGTVVAALHSARQMRSDVEKRIVLSQVPSGMLRNARVTAAYRQVVDSMRSDTERSISLRRLVDGSR